MQTQYRWHYLHPEPVTRIDEWQQVILANRGWMSDDLKAEFSWDLLTPDRLDISPDALATAIPRIETAIQDQQRVVIFGDYDVDGNGATAIMWQGLQQLGLTATPFIPDRFRHGYGMSVVALQEICADHKPDLIITVDNGITAHDALTWCQQEGIDVIVTDHHQPETKKSLPALALVHTTQLSGAGVAWFLVWQLQEKLLGSEAACTHAQELLDLVALATIVDQVPLTGLNRRLVKAGIRQLQTSKRPGIIALCEGAGCQQTCVSPHDIGFGLGPRINAIGRLKGSLDALRLLCTSKLGYAQQLASDLSDVNRERQELTRDQLELARSQIDPDHLDHITIVASPDFHEGIIGLVASKLVDEYHRPAIAIQIGDTVAKGSARSIPGINITDFIREFRADLLDVGGHALAAGFSVAPGKLEQVVTAMKTTANKTIQKKQLVPTLTIEAPVALDVLFHPFIPALLDELNPCGPGNAELIVSVTGKVASVRPIGSEGQHLRVSLSDDKRYYLSVLAWHWEDSGLPEPKVGDMLTVVGTLQINEYRGSRSPQIIATDWKKLKKSRASK